MRDDREGLAIIGLCLVFIAMIFASGFIVSATRDQSSLPTQTPYVVVVTATPEPVTPTTAPVPSSTVAPQVLAIENPGPGDLAARYTWRDVNGKVTLVLDQIIVPRESITFTVGSKSDSGAKP